MTAMTHLIPTMYKGNLPYTHSYPIGAEAISTALQNTPQIAQLKLSFSFHPQVTSLSFSERAIPVMGASYHHFDVRLSSSNELIKAGRYEEQWGISVQATLRTQRARVKELLLAEGLPRVAEWLATPRDEVWRYGRKSCEILYSPLDDALVIKED